MIYNLKVIKLQVVSLVTIKSIILVLFLNCSSAKRNQSQKEIQNAIFEITDHHFGSFIENSKEGYVWINNKKELKLNGILLMTRY